MHALGVQVPTGLLAGREVGSMMLGRWNLEAQKRNLPRFRMSLPSSAGLTAFILSKSVGVFAQAAT
jgi:hypothetical protein